jgi:hypothetical protein
LLHSNIIHTCRSLGFNSLNIAVVLINSKIMSDAEYLSVVHVDTEINLDALQISSSSGDQANHGDARGTFDHGRDNIMPTPKRTSTCRGRTKSSDWIHPMNTIADHLSLGRTDKNIIEDLIVLDEVAESSAQTSAICFLSGGLDNFDDECCSLASAGLTCTSFCSKRTSQTFVDNDDIHHSSPPSHQGLGRRTKNYINDEPEDLDILLGRGLNNHIGNVEYLKEVAKRKDEYILSSKIRKNQISMEVLSFLHSQGKRFLARDKSGFFIVNDTVARKKVSQALREGQCLVKFNSWKEKRAKRKDDSLENLSWRERRANKKKASLETFSV